MLQRSEGLTPDYRETTTTVLQQPTLHHLGAQLGLENASLRQPVPAVAPTHRSGVVDGLIKTCERWKLKRPDWVTLLGYNGDELGAEQIFRNRIRASRDVVDRTGYVLGISIGLAALFNNSIEAEIAWLNRPNPKLDNATPMAVMLNGKMISLITVFNLVNYERAL